MKTTTTELAKFRPVILFDSIISRAVLGWFRFVFFCIFVLGVMSMLVQSARGEGTISPALLGSTLLFFGLWLEQVLLYAYHNSFYFRGFDSKIASGNKSSVQLSFEAAQLLLKNEADVTAAFCQHPLGLEILVRCNLTVSDITTFVQSPRVFVAASAIPLHPHHTTTVADIAHELYASDLQFHQLLESHGVQPEIFKGAVALVQTTHDQQKRLARWWSRDQLSKQAGIGRSLAFGIPFELQKFSTDVGEVGNCDLVTDSPAALAQIHAIEGILARDKASNLLLVTPSETNALAILATVAKRVTGGTGLNALAGLQFRVLDTNLLLSLYPNALDLETELIRILDQAMHASTNVIIIPRISEFITAGTALGVSIPNILETYLIVPSLHCIGIDTPHNFHTKLTPQVAMLARFEEMLLEETSLADTVTVLESIVTRQERRRGVLFTYDAIVTAAQAAERYMPTGSMPEKAIDLIHEVARAAKQQGVVVINSPFVLGLIADKTGIPVGPITQNEREQLLNLEDILHERIVGQEAAVQAIARTLRRARVDIERADKPIGSFLFLGPTGVGKTETAKALAAIYFGDENRMVRLDMSEFSQPHTLGYLTGDENGTGILTDRLQEHPYTILLLDEFEKAHRSVHDLFLQILDEGYFTSTHGTKVNARNTIIIATSNAGSDLIFKTTAIRSQVPHLDADIIAHIVKEGIFRPELLNRFDSTIIFEPLDDAAQTQVATLLINDLTKRVQTQGYHLQVAPELLHTLIAVGYQPHTGGRGIGRAIQDILEEKIAQKIISGVVTVGGYIHLTTDDFTTAELTVS